MVRDHKEGKRKEIQEVKEKEGRRHEEKKGKEMENREKNILKFHFCP